MGEVMAEQTMLRYASRRLRAAEDMALAALERTAGNNGFWGLAYEFVDESIAGRPAVVKAVSEALLHPRSRSLKDGILQEHVILRWFDHGGMRFVQQTFPQNCQGGRQPKSDCHLHALLMYRSVAIRILESWPHLWAFAPTARWPSPRCGRMGCFCALRRRPCEQIARWCSPPCVGIPVPPLT
jgi:hypothetical protein